PHGGTRRNAAQGWSMRNDQSPTSGGRTDATASQPVPVVTVTTDASLGAAVAGLVEALQDTGLAVAQRTFLPTPPCEERARRIVLLAHTAPLRTLVALVAPPTAAG